MVRLRKLNTSDVFVYEFAHVFSNGLVVLETNKGEVLLGEYESGEPVGIFEHYSLAHVVALFADKLLTKCADNSFWLWDINSQKPIAIVPFSKNIIAYRHTISDDKLTLSVFLSDESFHEFTLPTR